MLGGAAAQDKSPTGFTHPVISTVPTAMMCGIVEMILFLETVQHRSWGTLFSTELRNNGVLIGPSQRGALHRKGSFRSARSASDGGRRQVGAPS